MIPDTSKSEKLSESDIIWLSTVTPKNTPHLVPIWFVLYNSKIYCCTGKASIKVQNLKENPNVAFALEDGKNPVIGTGHSIIIDPPYSESVVDLFLEKYDWNIRNDLTYDCVLEITPTGWLMNG